MSSDLMQENSNPIDTQSLESQRQIRLKRLEDAKQMGFNYQTI